MDRAEFLDCLRGEAIFAGLGEDELTPVGGGLVSAHAYRVRRDGRDYFVKDVTDNERDTLRALIQLRLRHVLHVARPALLERGVLVADHVAGGHIAGKALEPGLLADYATIQNNLRWLDGRQGPTDGDYRFYRECTERAWRVGRERLDRLCAEEGWPVLQGYRVLADRLEPGMPGIAEEGATMPYGWMHNDFREENILAGPPQTIVDWGSSYGPGPFAYDLAPFCLGHEPNLTAFAERSAICRAAGPERVRRWFYVAAAARFWGAFLYLDELAGARGVRAWLEYQFATYGRLPEWAASCGG